MSSSTQVHGPVGACRSSNLPWAVRPRYGVVCRDKYPCLGTERNSSTPNGMSSPEPEINQMLTFSVGIEKRPPCLTHGARFLWNVGRKHSDSDEVVLGLKLVADRKLFGQCYRGMLPELYRQMSPGSGVMIYPFLPTKFIAPRCTFPGDLDLMVVPYQDDQLLLSETLVVELKIVRASFAKQGKSPNEFGFSQAKAALELGFPYVAVGHLIVSDTSPSDYWKSVVPARILDADSGRVELLPSILADLLPAELIDRSFGRLLTNRPIPQIGLFAAFLSDNGMWIPRSSHAIRNSDASHSLLLSIARFYEAHFNRFLDTPKYASTS